MPRRRRAPGAAARCRPARSWPRSAAAASPHSSSISRSRAERLVGVQQEHRQQRPLPGAADRHHAVAVDDLERSEDAEFDAQSPDRTGPVVTALKPRPARFAPADPPRSGAPPLTTSPSRRSRRDQAPPAGHVGQRRLRRDRVADPASSPSASPTAPTWSPARACSTSPAAPATPRSPPPAAAATSPAPTTSRAARARPRARARPNGSTSSSSRPTPRRCRARTATTTPCSPCSARCSRPTSRGGAPSSCASAGPAG